MQKLLFKALSLLAVIVAFAGCESNNSFMTKAGIDDKLQGTWDMVSIPTTDPPVVWQFDNGKIFITYYDHSHAIIQKDEGTYAIVAKIATPYIVLDGKLSSYAAGRWVIINLDKKYLTLNRQSDGSYGTKQREFVKR